MLYTDLGLVDSNFDSDSDIYYDYCSLCWSFKHLLSTNLERSNATFWACDLIG